MFTKKQVDEILDIIEFNTTFFIGGNLGKDSLKQEDLDILQKFGVKKDYFTEEITSYDKSYYLGKLSSILKEQTKKIDYNNFKKYIQRGQYIPLTPLDKQVLSHLKSTTYSHIKNLERGIKTDILGIINASEIDHRLYYEDLIKEEITRTVTEKDSVKSVVSKIGEKTKNWERDLGRIAETEMQNAYSYGKFNEFITKYKDRDIKIFKEVYPGACKHCIKLYLTKGVGSQPILFTPQQLLENGNNIGRKPEEWKAVIPATHPFCRCNISVFFDNQKWNPSKGDFDYKEVDKKYEGEIKITVGDKTFVV